MTHFSRFCAILACVTAATVLAAVPAMAKTIDVEPGRKAIAKALGRASDGDTLRLHGGRYRESLIVGKRVDIVAARGERPVIDGRCRTGVVIAVRIGGVLLRGLTVVGADEGFGSAPINVDFSGVGTGAARGLTVRNTCSDEVEYGINVFNSRKIDITGNVARGFSDAGIYVGGITTTGNGAILMRRNETFANNRGFILEDITGGRLILRGNDIHDNTIPGHGPPSGVFLHNANGVLIADNSIADDGEIGVHLDENSNDNVLNGNDVSGSPTPLLNEGNGNCGTGNDFGGAGNVLPAC
jgi:parallel beta-helix repeat protein